MKKGIARIFLQALLLLSMFSLSFPITVSESSSPSDSLYMVGKEVEISPGNTTIHYVYLDYAECLDFIRRNWERFPLLNVTINKAGRYHIEIWIDIFNPSKEQQGYRKFVFENQTYYATGVIEPIELAWPLEMIDIFGTLALNLSWIQWILYPCFSAHEYRKCAMHIITDLEIVKPGIIEYSIWEIPFFPEEFSQMLEQAEAHNFVNATVTDVKFLNEDEAPKFPEPPQPPNEFDIVVYANGTAT